MDILAYAVVALFLPVSLTVLLICQALDKRRRRKHGLPPKAYRSISDFDIIDVFIRKRDD